MSRSIDPCRRLGGRTLWARASRWARPFLVVVLAALAVACSGTSQSQNADVRGDSSAADTTGNDAPNGDTIGPTSCGDDSLRTGLVAQQTGVSVDAFDCQILAWASSYNEPDPMLIKAIIYGESRFDQLAVACPNKPCGTPSGWSDAESGCYGLMQVVPACGSLPDNAGLLPNGHPNLENDPLADGWTTSIFNPEVNIQIGIAGIAGNRKQVEQRIPGCSEDQYTILAISDYSSYGSAKSCTTFNQSYIDSLLKTYQQYAAAAGYTPRSY